MDRRMLMKYIGATAAVGALPNGLYAQGHVADALIIDEFNRPDSLDIGPAWESLNPGYWRIESQSMRRKLSNYGDRARRTGFPYHHETHIGTHDGYATNGVMPIDYDPSLPLGIAWSRETKAKGAYRAIMSAEVKALPPEVADGDDESWAMHSTGYGVIGLAIGGKTQFESFYPSENASVMLALSDDGRFGLVRHTGSVLEPVAPDAVVNVDPISVGDVLALKVDVSPDGGEWATLTGTLFVNDQPAATVAWRTNEAEQHTSGYLGVAARGLLDVAVTKVLTAGAGVSKLNAPLNDCHTCYPLGDTLQQIDKDWIVRFVGVFRTDGKWAEIRVSDSENPAGGWASQPIAGRAKIISNEFRRNTALIDVTLPHSPSAKTQYYTVWKDGVNVTTDPRIGADSVGPGTGLVGDVPERGTYVGRLPRLAAPYKVCGLSCHAINTAKLSSLPEDGGADTGERWPGISAPFFVHDQPTYGAFRHIDDFDYQVMLWDDDVWYMELLLFPPSTDDAYKIVNTTIAGPTTRWQMMRHWNVMNPGDHDFGMDDVKGPEQLVLRNRGDLGQDPDYLRRNLQITLHLMMGIENPDGAANPKRWRSWKMPDRDFSLFVLDSRLWRSSQDTAIWDDEGWGADKDIYTRNDPTRTLLGEEQFAWLALELRTDSSPLICITGLNCLHTLYDQPSGGFDSRNRVAADYAGWVKKGADRVLDMMSARDGVITVGGDIHIGSVVRNVDLGLYECSFGPIGRWGGRKVKPGFGPRMKDHDGRDVEVLTFYHHEFGDAKLRPLTGPKYWNVLEAAFDPRGEKPTIDLAIRNIVDAPSDAPRGGGAVNVKTAETGRRFSSRLPKLTTLPNADVLFLSADGDPIRGVRSLDDGRVPLGGLVDVERGSSIMVVARAGDETDSQLVRTI